MVDDPNARQQPDQNNQKPQPPTILIPKSVFYVVGAIVVFLFLAYVAKRVIVAREARHMRPDDEATGTQRSDGMGD